MFTNDSSKKFLIKKINKFNPDLTTNYKEIFEDPDKYFSNLPNVIIGINFSRRNKVKESLDPNIMKIAL